MLSSLHIKVDKNNIRTLHEEYDYLEEQMWQIGNFFVCDVHPNKIRAALITRRRLYHKLKHIKQQKDYSLGAD